MTSRRAIVASLLAAGCAAAPPASAPASSSAAPPVATAPASRYQIGDHVTYRYSGTFTATPVTLSERIVEKTGNRLVIEVAAQRGADERRWRQVVTDTPENEKNNVVDELYEIVDGAPRRLANRNNEDLYRLYEWTMFAPDGKAHDVHSSRARVTLAERAFDCERTEGKNVWHGRPLRFEAFDCPEFVWTHGSARFWDEASGDDILRVDVIDAGGTEPSAARRVE